MSANSSKPVNLSRALAIPGWTSEEELTWLARTARDRHFIAEIGSWKGRSTRALADNTPGHVFAIDTWAGTAEDGHFKELAGKPDGWLLAEFLRNKSDNTTAVPLPSVMAAQTAMIGTYKFDMIFIDGAHDYKSVLADILAWMPLLSPGGLICGHDFDGGRPGVVKAVRQLFDRPRMAGAGSIWVGE